MFGPRFPIYHQLDSRDCGPACLRMVAAYHGRHVSLEYLREQLGLARQGVTLYDLSQVAEQLGFRTLPAEVALDTLQHRVPLPCIAYLDQEHFVVVYAARRGYLHVADPHRGRVRYAAAEFEAKWQLPGQPGQGIVLLLEPTPQLTANPDEAPGAVPSATLNVGYLLSYVRPYRRLVGQLLLGLVVGSLLALAFPFLTQSIIDIGISTRSLRFLYAVCGAQLMLFAGRTVIELLRGRILLLLGSRVSIALLSDYLARLMRLPMSFFEAKNVGDNVQRIVDHHRIELFLTTTLVDAGFAVLNLLVFGGVLLLYSGSIFGVFAACTGLGAGWALLWLGRRQRLDHRRFQQQATNQNVLLELIGSMPEIKLTGSEHEKRWRWEEMQAKTYRLGLQSLQLDQTIQSGILFFNELKNILITLLAGYQVIEGRLTLGMMLSVTYLAGQLNNPVLQLLQFLKTWQDARLSLARFDEVYQKPPEDAGATLLAPATGAGPAAIELRDVHFHYGGPAAPPVLRGLDLTIAPGQVTAIVGLSGSGKTTLLKLLLKFYEPTAGSIVVGGTPLGQLDARAWRQRCGVVMQEGHIFADTLGRNVAVGQGPPDPERLRQACRVANLAEFINELPLGFDTPVGGTGAGLSQGQKQRLLIARAAYRDPELLLFDEATNALDATNERAILDNLQAFFAGRTVVVVAHRLSTVQHADQIVVLEQGRVRERGTHTELLALRGAYFNLVRNQLALSA
jgi:ATP-binding cassette subfamily B protein